MMMKNDDDDDDHTSSMDNESMESLIQHFALNCNFTIQGFCTVLYRPANDPGPQMIPVPQMIPKLDRK